MPVHHLLERILDEYIVVAGLQSGQPLFQSLNSVGTEVTGRALNRYNAWAAIRKRAKAAGFLTPVGCHTWRATGITIYLENDGRLEHAQQMESQPPARAVMIVIVDFEFQYRAHTGEAVEHRCNERQVP
jgi:integrase/recombinase XerD